jgi:hypothetical protein
MRKTSVYLTDEEAEELRALARLTRRSPRSRPISTPPWPSFRRIGATAYEAEIEADRAAIS